MLLRETSDRQLVERRDELLRQVDGINNEIARRFRERQAEQRNDRDRWLRTQPANRLALYS